MSSIKFPDPYLPLELERLIFELAVAKHGIRASTPLSLVAKRVCEWLRPLIFRVINLTRRRTVSSDNYKIPQSIGPFVQHIIINGYLVVRSLSSILSSCPNVINLAIQGHYENHALHVMSHLTHLTVPSSCIQPPDKLPIQPQLNLTHLSIHGFNPKPSWREWEFLAHLPKLTHVCADNTIQDYIPTVLPLCPRLKLLVMVSFVSYICIDNLPDLYLVDDNRLVLMVVQSYSTYALDWERGANGGVDLWIFAERVAFARSRKYFARPLPKLISEGPRMGGISE